MRYYEKKLGIKSNFKIKYTLYCFRPMRIKDLFYAIKRKIKSVKYGFDISDTWSLDYSLAEWLYPRLMYLKDNTISYPCDMEYKEWLEILDIIATKIGKYLFTIKNIEASLEDEKKAYSEYKEAMGMVHKYLHDLWD